MGSLKGGEEAIKRRCLNFLCIHFPPWSTFQCFHTVPSCTPGISPFRFSAGKQVSITHCNAWPRSSVYTWLPSVVHVCAFLCTYINSSTSYSWISLDWHPGLCPLLALRHSLFSSSVPNTNSFSPGFCCPYSDSCSSHTTWPWSSMPRPLSILVPVRRLILEVWSSDSVAQIHVSTASLGSSG